MTTYTKGASFGPNEHKIWTSGIHVDYGKPDHIHGNGIECFGRTRKEAEGQRDVVLAGLQLTIPPIRNDAELHSVIGFANFLSDHVGDVTTHPAYPLLDKVMDTVAAWEDEHVQL